MADGTIDNSASAYIEAPVTLLGFGFGVNPAEVTGHHPVLPGWSADHVRYLIVVIKARLFGEAFLCAVYLTQLDNLHGKSNRQTPQSGQSEGKQASGCS